MNRIFHARIAIGQYLFLVLTTIIVIYAMWMQHAVMAVLFMLLLVIAIERLIHTTYTLTTDDRLLKAPVEATDINVNSVKKSFRKAS